MKIYVSKKSILSQPLRALLFILLIGGVTFGFTARAFEGIIVYRELHRLEGEYHTIGQLIPLSEWEWGISNVRELLEESPLVASMDNLRVIQGVMEGVYSPDYDGGTPYINQMFVYGTLVDKEKLDLALSGGEHVSYVYFPYLPYIDIYIFDIIIDTIEVSLPEYVEVGETKRFFLVDYRGINAHVYEEAEIGQRYFLGGHYSRNISWARWFNQLFYIPLSPQPSRRWWYGTYDLVLSPLGLSGETFLYPVSENEVVKDPEIIEQIHVLRENVHTIFLRPTKDLTANPLATSSLTLLEGRLIDETDYINKNPVVVIRGEFARIRGLELGDTLTITMRERPFATEHLIPDSERSILVPSFGQRITAFEYGKGPGYWGPVGIRIYGRYIHDPVVHMEWPREDDPNVDGILYGGIFFPNCRGIDEIIGLEMTTGYLTNLEIWQGWQELETITKDFEIVGIYGTTDRLTNFRSVSYNNVFLPDSVVPSHWTQDALHRNFSFTLQSPRDEQAFVSTYQDKIEELGFWVLFSESGWSTFNSVASPIRTGLLAGVIAFMALTVLLFRLVLFIFFASRRKEYAIMRALGTPKKRALRGLCLVVALLGFFGVLLGVIPAWFFAIERAQTVLTGLEGAIFTPLSFIWFFIFTGVVIALFLSFILLEVFRLKGYSELELLQNNPVEGRNEFFIKRKPKYSKKSVVSFIINSMEDDLFTEEDIVIVVPDFQEKNFQPHGSVSALGRFLSMNILRRKIRTLLTVIIAAGFIVVLSFMEVSIQNNLERVDWFYDNTIVSGTIVIDPSIEQTNLADRISSGLLRNILRLEYIHREETELNAHHEDIETYSEYLETHYENLENEEGIPFIYSFATETNETSFMTTLSVETLRELEATRRDHWDYSWLFESPQIISAGILSFNNLESYEIFHGTELHFIFMEGYDVGIFSGPYEGELFILLSPFLKEELDVALGDTIKLAPAPMARARDFTFYRVVGTFESTNTFLNSIVPLNHLQEHFRTRLIYDRLEFEVNPALNRQMDAFRKEITPYLTAHEPSFILVLRDHLLRGVIEPLEGNIAMMSMLYPIILVLSAFISVGLTMLLLLSVIKQATIMRVLGMSKTRVINGWMAEQGFLCVLGIGFGLLISLLIVGGVSLLGVVIYLVGNLIGGLIFMTVLIRKKPLELLQMRE